jgi:putative transposase
LEAVSPADIAASVMYGSPASRAARLAAGASLNTTRAHPNALASASRYRQAVFAGRHLVRLEEITRDDCADFVTELAEFNGEPSHVHLLVHFPPKVALSKLANSLKGVSSRQMRQEFPDPRRHHRRTNRLWSGLYFAGSAGGAPTSALRRYIEQQNQPG